MTRGVFTNLNQTSKTLQTVAISLSMLDARGGGGGGGGGGGTPIHYLYGYVPPNRVVILKLLI